MDEIEVIEWINGNSNDFEVSINYCGGFFYGKKGMTWTDYLDNFDLEDHKYLEAIRRSTIENKVRIDAGHHQSGPKGKPLFSDNTTCELSMRAWGDLMAAIWTEEENEDYDYIHFYSNANP